MKLRDGGSPPRQKVLITSRGPQSLGPDVRPALSLPHRERPRAQRKTHVDPHDRLSAWSRPPLRGQRTLPRRSRRGGCVPTLLARAVRLGAVPKRGSTRLGRGPLWKQSQCVGGSYLSL